MTSDQAQNHRSNFRQVNMALRRRLLEKYGHTCPVCGISNEMVDLELAHIVPVHLGGDSSETNLMLLCPNCHHEVDRQPREVEFVNFLAELLRRHPSYREVRQEALLGRETRFRADILVQRQNRNIQETLLIECKTHLALYSNKIRDIIAQLKKYHTLSGESLMVLAVPGTLREQDLSALRQESIEVWDLQYLAEEFSAQIKDASVGYYKALLLAKFSSPAYASQAKKLIDRLSACRPGPADWLVYQSLIGDILEYLFMPPLSKPISELSDEAKANRRDFIMPNYADKGFWSFVREQYAADYIVVDAKNYTRKIKKEEVLQIANYLKAHGAGLFGMIISRDGGDIFGCKHTIREQWMIHKKLIIVLNDEDIVFMITAKSEGRSPEEFIGQKIQRFRLSM